MPEFRPLRTENHPVNQRRYSPAVSNWIYARNGIPGMRIGMMRDPGRWGRNDTDPDGFPRPGAAGAIVYDLDFSHDYNSMYFGVV